MTNSQLRERLTEAITLLQVPGIGGGRFKKLTERFGSAAKVMAAGLDELESVSGISRSLAEAIHSQTNPAQAAEKAAQVIQLGWTALFLGDSDYPKRLAEITSAPPLLFRLGEDAPEETGRLAIVGTRRSSEEMRRFTWQLARDLAADGLVVVSGMAEGIDAAAHVGALDAGGKTVAVWGTPLNVVYPPSHRDLAARIKEHGAIYSEYLPGTELSPSFFPERNRIISGLSDGVIVVEAGQKSGALITAKYALDQNRDLLAVPGAPGSDRAVGTNALIKKGASLITEIADIYAAIPRLKGEIKARKFKRLPDLTDQEREMVSLLSNGPLQLDQLCRATNLSVQEMLEFMLALELKGVVQEISGKRFILTE